MFKGLLPIFMPTLLMALVTGCAATPTPSPLQAEAPRQVKAWWCYTSVYDPQKTENTLRLCLGGNNAYMGIFYPNNGADSTICKQGGTKQTLPTYISVMLDTGTCKNGRLMKAAIWRCNHVGEDIDCRNEEDPVSLRFMLTSTPEKQ